MKPLALKLSAAILLPGALSSAGWTQECLQQYGGATAPPNCCFVPVQSSETVPGEDHNLVRPGFTGLFPNSLPVLDWLFDHPHVPPEGPVYLESNPGYHLVCEAGKPTKGN